MTVHLVDMIEVFGVSQSYISVIVGENWDSKRLSHASLVPTTPSLGNHDASIKEGDGGEVYSCLYYYL